MLRGICLWMESAIMQARALGEGVVRALLFFALAWIAVSLESWFGLSNNVALPCVVGRILSRI